MARQVGSQELVAHATVNLGILAMRTGDFANAQTLLERSLEGWRAMRSRTGLCWTLAILGRVASFQAAYARADALLEQALALVTGGGAN